MSTLSKDLKASFLSEEEGKLLAEYLSQEHIKKQIKPGFKINTKELKFEGEGRKKETRSIIKSYKDKDADYHDIVVNGGLEIVFDKNLNLVVFGDILGRGGMGKVCACEVIDPKLLGQPGQRGKRYAIKEQKFRNLNEILATEDYEKTKERIMGRRKIAKREAVLAQKTDLAESHMPAKNSEMASYIIMPLAKGDEVFEHMKAGGSGYGLERRIDIGISAMEDLLTRFHERGIIHRDLKTENMMFDPVTGTVKIIDPGLSVDLDKARKFEKDEDDKEETDNRIEIIKKEYGISLTKVSGSRNVFVDDKGNEYYIPKDQSRKGTPETMSPEIRQSTSPRYSFKSDVYAMGM